MKFYLVKDAQALELSCPVLSTSTCGWTLPTLQQLNVEDLGGSARRRDKWIKFQNQTESMMFFDIPPSRTTTLIPMVSEKEEKGKGFWDTEVMKKCAIRLTTALSSKSLPVKGGSWANLPTVNFGKIKLTPLEITLLQLREDCNGSNQNTFLSVGLGRSRNVALKRLHQIFGSRVKLTLELYFGTRGGSPTRAGIITSEMEIRDTNGVFCIDTKVPMTKAMEKFWSTHSHSHFLWDHPTMLLTMARCNIILTVSDTAELFSDLLPCDTNRKILEKGLASDFEIVASNGAVLKCHRSFLMVNSRVLTVMLDADMSEASTRQMKMVDTSEAGVRALLMYLYCDDWRIAKQDLEIAFELLKIGHKYEISKLEETMLRFFCELPNVYITDDLAMRLLPFASRIENGGALNQKLNKIDLLEDSMDCT